MNTALLRAIVKTIPGIKFRVSIDPTKETNSNAMRENCSER